MGFRWNVVNFFWRINKKPHIANRPATARPTNPLINRPTNNQPAHRQINKQTTNKLTYRHTHEKFKQQHQSNKQTNSQKINQIVLFEEDLKFQDDNHTPLKLAPVRDFDLWPYDAHFTFVAQVASSPARPAARRSGFFLRRFVQTGCGRWGHEARPSRRIMGPNSRRKSHCTFSRNIFVS